MIDPGDDPTALRLELAGMGTRAAGILVTHTDVDHIGGVAALAEGTGAEVWAPAGEVEALRTGATARRLPGRAARPRARRLGRRRGHGRRASPSRSSTCPGHSAGHIAFHSDGQLFSGDVLFAGSVGRHDLPGGDWETLLASIRSLTRALPARHDRLSRARAGDDARPRAPDEPVSARAAGPAGVSAKFQAPRGTHDVLPADADWWHVVRTMEEVTALYGWRRIQTPGFEDTGLFARTAGEASDVVHKEMYTFTDRSDRSLTLRPEGTAPIARAYVEHGLHREPQPVKAYTIAPMYRYGAPGRGRYREHYQLSVEAIGSADPAIDAEIIQLYVELLRRLGVTQWELHLNSIGDANCRPQYVERLNAWLDEHADLLDEDARHKRADEPAAGLRREGRRAPRRAGGRAEDRRVALRRLPGALRRRCAPNSTSTACRTSLDPTLVRGLDYYSRTTFEFIAPVRERELVDLRRRPLRRPRRGDRRPGDARHRLRRRHRAAAARARARRQQSPSGRGSTSSSSSATARRASGC